MGKIIETIVDRFNDGIINDPRSSRGARVVTNFDILTDAHRMIPYRNSEDGSANSSTNQQQNFAIALRTGTTYSLYSLGRQNAVARAEVLYKDLTTGSSWDLDDSAWNTPANNISSAGTVNYELFVYYKLAGLIIGARAGTNLFAFSPTGSAWQDSWQALTYTNMAQGLVFSNDILYIPYDNKIASYNHVGTAFDDTAFTVPSHLKITSICERGSYLAVGCAPLSGLGESEVFLWDTTSATWSERYSVGRGSLRALEEIDGVLIAISSYGGSTTVLEDKVLFRRLEGGKFKIFEELVGALGTISNSFPIAKQKINERLYFMLKITLNGAVREGVWSVGRLNSTTPFGIVHERTSNNDTALTSGQLRNFIFADDYLFQSHIDNGVFKITKTNDATSYATSIYETRIFNNGIVGNTKTKDSSQVKKLSGVSVMFEPLPANGQVVLKYRQDGATAFDTIFTEGTNDSISFSAVNVNGVDFDNHKEIEFRLEATGGAVITGLRFKEEIIDNQPY